MLGLVSRLLGGLVTPLVDQVSASSTRLLRKLALFVVAGLALNATLIALTMAFELWVASKAGHIVGALAVAGIYLVIAIVALGLALRRGTPRGAKPRPTPAASRGSGGGASSAASAESERESDVDAFAAPLLAMLQKLGLRREQLAVLAGTSLAKELGPIPLVGLAIVAGFLIGRMGRGWRSLVSTDVLAGLLSPDLIAAFLRRRGSGVAPDDDEPAETG